MRRDLRSKGIVINRKYFSEADAIVTIYSQDYGKGSYVAKGIKRIKSRKKAGLEPFCLIDFSATKTKALPILTETSLINYFSGIRKDIKKVAVAYYMLELINKTSFEDQENEEIYDLLEKYLGELEIGVSLKKTRLEFANNLLVTLGFWPKGKPMIDTDLNVERVIEKNLNTLRVGRALVV